MQTHTPLIPEMPAEAITALEQHLRHAHVYLEYGSGGSTALAAELGVPTIVSVESSAQWIDRVDAAIAELHSKSQLRQIHADIGTTGDWGRPLDRSAIERWPLYPLLAWRRLRELQLSPELVLIDGRFRVACFCTSLIQARTGTVILFDDYLNRPGYHVVESVCPPPRMHDRMAEFCVPAQVDHGAVLDLLMAHIHQVD